MPSASTARASHTTRAQAQPAAHDAPANDDTSVFDLPEMPPPEEATLQRLRALFGDADETCRSLALGAHDAAEFAELGTHCDTAQIVESVPTLVVSAATVLRGLTAAQAEHVLLDAALCINITASLLILMAVLNAGRPVEFSTFPSVLVLEPGEEATIWIPIKQGFDPFDKNNWYRAKVYTDSRWITEVGDLQEQKQLEWTSAKERTSVIQLAANVSSGTRIPLLLDNESWSYTWTPDMRYGVEKLYQAFQLHRRHLHRYELVVPGKPATNVRKP